MTTLIFVFFVLLLTAWAVHRWAALPKNITLLFLAAPLVMASAPLLVFASGVIAAPMAAKEWLTLPVGLMIVGVAAATVPAAMLAKRLGRRNAVLLGFFVGLCGHLLAAWAVYQGQFMAFCLAAFMMGNAGAFGQQLRFAGMESLPDSALVPRAVAILMFTGIFAALIGPELVLVGQGVVGGEDSFVAVFLSMAVLVALAMVLILGFENEVVSEDVVHAQGRALLDLLKQPVLWVAMLAAALGFGLMSLIMTATPLSMHHAQGHDLVTTKWVIQSHVAAMYLPSLLTLWLGNRLPIRLFLVVGALCYVAVLIIAMQGHAVMHYWWALVVLGIGWNFLYFSGTNLLPRCYTAAEKHKVQALNDFVVFTVQGASSLLAGWVIFGWGWSGILNISWPFVAVIVLVSLMAIQILKPPAAIETR